MDCVQLAVEFTLLVILKHPAVSSYFEVSVHIYAAHLVIYLSSEYVLSDYRNYSELFKTLSLYLSMPTKYVLRFERLF
jgi:hypothetical protein